VVHGEVATTTMVLFFYSSLNKETKIQNKDKKNNFLYKAIAQQHKSSTCLKSSPCCTFKVDYQKPLRNSNYSETSLNRTLRKPVLPEYQPIFSVPRQTILCKRSLTKPANFFVPVLAGLEKFHCITRYIPSLEISIIL
jgi:hypothetical protein